tara:strand:+ start:1294 stop:1695 length:402 start_codon:yes stop_codon:yes gene_type:complete
MATIEIGTSLQAKVTPALAPEANVKIAKTAILPDIRKAAEQFSKHKTAAVDQLALSAEKVQQALETINDQLRQSSTSLAFSIDAASELMVIQVTDQDSGEVLFTFPGEAALKVAVQINQQLDTMKGILFDKQS